MHRAAARLGIAQPALTQQIKALEREMSVRLVVREGRGIALTAVGRAFHLEARSILLQAERALAMARDMEAGRAGMIRVGFTESASFHPIVTQTLNRFRLAWPNVECRLEEKHTEALVTSLEDETLDAAFVRPPLRTSKAVTFRRLASESMVVALPRDHRFAVRRRLSVGELADEAFIVYPRRDGTGLSDAVVAECRRAGFMPRISQRTPQLSSTVNLVAAHMGIAIVPHCMHLQRAKDVNFVPLVGSELRAELGLAYRRGVTSRLLANFVEAVDSRQP
ncbi:LysR family transcriptional regulator [Bradyrhizobium manausense]